MGKERQQVASSSHLVHHCHLVQVKQPYTPSDEAVRLYGVGKKREEWRRGECCCEGRVACCELREVFSSSKKENCSQRIAIVVKQTNAKNSPWPLCTSLATRSRRCSSSDDRPSDRCAPNRFPHASPHGRNTNTPTRKQQTSTCTKQNQLASVDCTCPHARSLAILLIVDLCAHE